MDGNALKRLSLASFWAQKLELKKLELAPPHICFYCRAKEWTSDEESRRHKSFAGGGCVIIKDLICCRLKTSAVGRPPSATDADAAAAGACAANSNKTETVWLDKNNREAVQRINNSRSRSRPRPCPDIEARIEMSLWAVAVRKAVSRCVNFYLDGAPVPIIIWVFS